MSTLAQHDFSKTIEKKFYYSEIFYSIQGEGHYTGVPTAWIRFFLCNLQCNGFGQLDPTNPDTYDLPFQDFDVKSVKRPIGYSSFPKLLFYNIPWNILRRPP